MDLQGTPIGSSSGGTKNTTDPRAKIPIQEGAGPVASDSLAAESTRAGGKFGENRDSAPLSVSGSSSTFNNTDTSAATTLAPAPDAQEREAKAAWQETSDSIKGPGGVKYDEGAGAQKDLSSSHSAEGQSGGSKSTQSSDSHGAGGQSGGSKSTQSTSGSSADPAPSYVASVNSEAAKTGKPHGKNITEGGFDSDPSKNASFTSDIGDKNDPGRAAENQFLRQTMESGNDAATDGPRQKGVTNDGQYDVLETEQNL
ncbi:MAG: 50S ribosomal L25 [Lasallia pustulata]|uniref:50S ribosomal L25 n=1 Tax=Lasallia pustulata TaxID=136370 RepID=A0A5M8PCU8_9LECA|nr:MAG: 50S ribosomal L25 [Lasallia pustulata]